MIPFKDDNPTRTFPAVTVLLISANVLIFLYQKFLGLVGQEEVLIATMAVVPYRLFHPDVAPVSPYLTLFTAMFMHGGLLHLLGNMLYLWVFGNNVEDTLGHIRYIFFYLICGVIATLAHVLSEPGSQTPLIGASGAIAGVLGAYAIRFPHARVHVLVFFIFIQIIRIPAFIVLGLWFLMQMVNASAASAGVGGGVAWFAHIGGFVAGLLYMLRHRPKRQVRIDWE